MKFEIRLNSPSGEHKRLLQLEKDNDHWRVLLDGLPQDVDVVEIAPLTSSVLLHGEVYEIRLAPFPDGTLKIQAGLYEFTAEVIDPRAWRGRRHGHVEVEGRQKIVAPMAGKVVRLLVAAGDKVNAGEGLLVVEAMKMQNEISSPKSGVVERVLVKEGQAVNGGEVLAWVD